MEWVRLGDVASKITKGTTPTSVGFNFVDEGINFIKAESISENGEFIENKFDHISDKCNEKLARSQLQENDILFSIAGVIGRTAIVKKEILPANTNQALAIIRVPPGIFDYSFLMYALKSPLIIEQYEKQKQGVAQINLSLQNVSDFRIPKLSLEDQCHIAAILDKVTDLIAQRRAQLDKLDLLVKSRFVEMFGDPHLNPKGWPITTIGNVIETIESGWSGNGTQRAKGPNEIAVLKVSAVTKGYFIPDECKVLDDQQNIKKYVYPQKGDLLFSRANTRELVGATAIVFEDHPDLILPDKLWKIHFTEEADVFYMKYILSTQVIRAIFSSISTGTSGSMYNVSMEKFKSIEIPLPTINEQRMFSSFVQEISILKESVIDSLERLYDLQKAFMQEYLK